MSNITSLDARALGQPGGFFQSITDGLNGAVNAWAGARDRQGERQYQQQLLAARLGRDDRNRMERLAELGIDPREAGYGLLPGADQLGAVARRNLNRQNAADTVTAIEGLGKAAAGFRAGLGMRDPNAKQVAPVFQTIETGDGMGTKKTFMWDRASGKLVDPPMDPGVHESETVKPAPDVVSAVDRYNKGGWFGAGQGDASPLANMDQKQLEQAFKDSGYNPPNIPTSGAPVAPPALGGGDQNQQKAATSFAQIQSLTNAARLSPDQKMKFLATQQDLHQRWLKAAEIGDQSGAARIQQAIVQHSRLLDGAPGVAQGDE
jgi:hypothetical protein